MEASQSSTNPLYTPGLSGTKPDDGIPRTDWFAAEVEPSVIGNYEAITGGGHIFKRRWDGKIWINAVNGEPTPVKMPWRGVVPGGISLERYNLFTRRVLVGAGEIVVGDEDD